MSLFNAPKAASRTLRALAALLSYPDGRLREALPALQSVLHEERALAPARLAEIDALVESLARAELLDVEADYVHVFDRGRATSLHLFEHVHGDSRDRGPAMIDLAQTYEKAGLVLEGTELPDFLPVVLEFASTQPPREAQAFLAEVAHILNAIFTALLTRRSRYASVLGALLDLAGEKAEAVELPEEESLDAAWEEPPAFGGCSSDGQSKPGVPQPIRIHRNATSAQRAQGEVRRENP